MARVGAVSIRRRPPAGVARPRSEPSPGPALRILLAGGKLLLLLEGLRSLLSGEFDVVACVRDLASLETEVTRLAPDLVVVGVGEAELVLVERLRAKAPGTRVLVLGAEPDPRLAARAFRLGALGFVVLSSSLDELRASLHAVRRGERFLTIHVARGEPARLSDDEKPLTRREREVVRLTAEGRQMKEVAAVLGITPRTVAFHKYRAMDKVGVRTSAELVRFALGAMPT